MYPNFYGNDSGNFILSSDVGEISIWIGHVVWKIRNFFSLPMKTDSVIRSPQFHFAGVDWTLEVRPKGSKLQRSEGWFEMLLLSHSDCTPCQVQFGIRKKDTTVTKSSILKMDNFEQFVKYSFVQWPTFAKFKNTFVPNGDLTTICYIAWTPDLQPNVELPISGKAQLGNLPAMDKKVDNLQVNDFKNDLTLNKVSEKNEELAQTLLDERKEISAEDSDMKKTEASFKGFVTLSQDLEKMYENDQFCDVQLKVQDRMFQTHKMILGARSAVFACMLHHDMKEKNTGIVEIDDCDPKIFEVFLYYLYCGKIERISPENVIDLYEVADKYDVKELKSECYRFMKERLSKDLFCDVMALAVKYGEKELIQQATEYFVTNAQKILLTVKWQNFLKEYPDCANELYIKALSGHLKV